MASLGVSTLYVKTFIYWNASNITKSGHEPTNPVKPQYGPENDLCSCRAQHEHVWFSTPRYVRCSRKHGISSRSGVGTARRLTEKKRPQIFPVVDLSGSPGEEPKPSSRTESPHRTVCGDSVLHSRVYPVLLPLHCRTTFF